MNEKITVNDLSIRLCTSADLDDIMQLQDRICASIENEEWFASTSREENASYLVWPNVIFGVYHGSILAAYGSIIFPGSGKSNPGWDLGWDAQNVENCAVLDTIVVDPAYRGLSLQKILIRRCVSHASGIMPGCTVLTTICPDNIYSLRNAQAEGFTPLMELKKYGGKRRYILSR